MCIRSPFSVFRFPFSVFRFHISVLSRSPLMHANIQKIPDTAKGIGDRLFFESKSVQ